MRQLEPFTELISKNLPWKYKKMRFLARMPFARRQFGPDRSASDDELEYIPVP